jgi:hypothetical protein
MVHAGLASLVEEEEALMSKPVAFQVRMSSREHATMTRLAARAGLSLSEFARKRLTAYQMAQEAAHEKVSLAKNDDAEPERAALLGDGDSPKRARDAEGIRPHCGRAIAKGLPADVPSKGEGALCEGSASRVHQVRQFTVSPSCTSAGRCRRLGAPTCGACREANKRI